MACECSLPITPEIANEYLYCGYHYAFNLKKGQTVTFTKYVAIVDDRNNNEYQTTNIAIEKAKKAKKMGYQQLYDLNDQA